MKLLQDIVRLNGDMMINPPAEDITAAETAPRPKKETKLKTKSRENLDNILIMLSKYT